MSSEISRVALDSLIADSDEVSDEGCSAAAVLFFATVSVAVESGIFAPTWSSLLFPVSDVDGSVAAVSAFVTGSGIFAPT